MRKYVAKPTMLWWLFLFFKKQKQEFKREYYSCTWLHIIKYTTSCQLTGRFKVIPWFRQRSVILLLLFFFFQIESQFLNFSSAFFKMFLICLELPQQIIHFHLASSHKPTLYALSLHPIISSLLFLLFFSFRSSIFSILLSVNSLSPSVQTISFEPLLHISTRLG